MNRRPRFVPLLSLLAIPLLALSPASAAATWSIIAIDGATGWVIISSATCVSQASLLRFPSKGLWDIQAIIVPGVGIAAAQAGVDRTRDNQNLIYTELKKGTDPALIIDMLAADPRFQSRQFGVVDIKGRAAGFSGTGNGAASLAVQSRVPGTQIHFSIQGNILASNDVVLDAVDAFLTAEGTAIDRVMAAMEAADAAGGDSRCTCETRPIPDTPCESKNAHVAYLIAAAPADPEGQSFNDGTYSVFIDVTDENITPLENANPVITLRKRYDAWKAEQRGAGPRPGPNPPEPAVS